MLTLIRNADVYAPERLGGCDLLIAGEQIVWLGATGVDLPIRVDPRVPLDVVDCEGRRLIPGLIDGHAHLTGGGGESGAASRVPPPPLSQYTLAGVTTVVGVLGTDDVTRNTADLVAAARGLVANGISAWCHSGGYHLPPATLTGAVRGDIAQVDRIIGVGEVAISDHRSSQPTLDEMLRVAAEAHVGGMMSNKAGVLHMHVGDGPRGLDLIRQMLEVSELPPRVFNPTHVNRKKALFEEALVLARRGCTIDITAFPVSEDDDAWAADVALERYLDSGAPPDRVTVSSDGGGCLPTFDADGRMVRMEVGSSSSLLETLALLQARGVALERVLPAFTSNVAALLRLPSKGRVAAGGDADLVVLSEDCRALDVMARGAWHVRGGRAARRGVFEVG